MKMQPPTLKEFLLVGWLVACFVCLGLVVPRWRFIEMGELRSVAGYNMKEFDERKTRLTSSEIEIFVLVAA